MKKKIIIAGGTGYLGYVLAQHFKASYNIIVLTRQMNGFSGGINYIYWDAKTLDSWQTELENSFALINLTGKSVNCRYTNQNKEEIRTSRIDSTILLNKAILSCNTPPEYFINASTATIYKDARTYPMTESAGRIGNDFSMSVAKLWEKAFFDTSTPRTLKTAIRTSIVLGNSGGAFPTLKKLAHIGLGGKQGNGQQMVSWIHEKDFARAVDHILSHQLTGVINVTSPNPIKNAFFMKAIQKNIKTPFVLSMPILLLKYGAKLIGTETELVLKSRYVHPERLLHQKFSFKYNTIDKALKNLTS
ncbi:epimerase [Neptunitalea chrysea]|uniref:Epimerase n=1 Tax=Neptunitalea chrysea TaxID=1647581 RepID=A0A9W6EVS5_9FLAO|nr:TIGR01777 family oxidoreductase [Neptunitalea chrysea]GLB53301.1 epimerase [Neptunitalea chrysea]